MYSKEVTSSRTGVAPATPIKPPALKEGDRVGLICPASRPDSPAVVERCKRMIEEMGFSPVLGKNVLQAHGHMAGTDSQRLEDLLAFANDDSISGIFCLTGGFGSLHLLPAIDYDLFARKPKVVVGCDDNTALMLALQAWSRLVTFHGPNLDQIQSKYTFQRFKAAVSSKNPLSSVSVHDVANDAIAHGAYAPVEGVISGPLLGGNLTALVSLMGTPFQPDFRNCILFLEDRDERHDTIDRWFTNLYVSGVLKAVRGVGFGTFENCNTKESYNMLSLEDLLGQRLTSMSKPSCFGLPLGQGKDVATVPLGVEASLDAGKGVLEFSNSALS